MLIDQFCQRLILVTDLEIPLSTSELTQENSQRLWEDWSRTCSFPSVPNRAGSRRNTCILTFVMLVVQPVHCVGVDDGAGELVGYVLCVG